MSNSYRRFEFLLPRRYNDGKPIPDEVLAETLLELEGEFGAVSADTQVIQGRWRHGGKSYRDELVRVFVDVPDTPENVEFFRAFKERLKFRFQQLDIWMTSHSVEVI